MLSSLKQVALAVTACMLGTASAELKDVQPWDDTRVLFTDYDYSVVSYVKPSEPDSVEIDKRMEAAQKLFTSKVEFGQWGKRKVGWFRIDLDANPDLGIDKQKHTGQVIYAETIKHQFNFTLESSEEEMARRVYDLSGDFFHEVSCEEISTVAEDSLMNFVFLGAKSLIDYQQEGEDFLEAAIYEKYSFGRDRVSYLYNGEPSCRTANGLDQNKQHILNFQGKKEPFQTLTYGEDTIKKERLLYEQAVFPSIRETKWGKRAYQAIFHHHIPPVFLVTPKEPSEVDLKRIALLQKMHEFRAEKNLSMLIFHETYGENRDPDCDVMPFTDMFSMPEDYASSIVFVHPKTNDIIPLTQEIEDIDNVTGMEVVLKVIYFQHLIEQEFYEKQIEEIQAEMKTETGNPLGDQSVELKNQILEIQLAHAQKQVEKSIAVQEMILSELGVGGSEEEAAAESQPQQTEESAETPAQAEQSTADGAQEGQPEQDL